MLSSFEKSADEKEEEREGDLIVENEAIAHSSLGLLSSDFESLTVQDLRKICLRNKLVGYKSLKKAGLIAFLIENRVQPPIIPLERLTKKQLIEKLRGLTSD